jgi:GT2 family glycosyltransferase
VSAPDLAVVVVSFETRSRTLTCVESVLAQAGPSLAVVVVDNASRDGTADALAAVSDPRLTVVANAANTGFGAACNQGAAAHPDARHVLFLNADTVVRPGALAALVAALDADDAPGAAGPAVVGADGREQSSVRGDPTPAALLFQHTALRFLRVGAPAYSAYKRPGAPDDDVPVVIGAALALRGDVLRATGGFDRRYFLYFEEADLCRRVRDAGHRVAVVRGALVEHAGGASSDPRRGPALNWYLRSLFLYVDRFHGRAYGLAYRVVFKPCFLLRMLTDAIRDALTWLFRPSKRADKAPELRLCGWFLVRGVWTFLVA